jgi:hypothetical protein
MLKGLVSLCVTLLFCSPVLSQYVDPRTGTSRNKDTGLYELALGASLDKMEKSWGAKYHNAIVESFFEITEKLPTEFGAHRVEYLGYQELGERYKKVREAFDVLHMHPMKIENGKLTVDITVHSFSYKKHRYFYAISDWSSVTFRFDCEKKEYVIDDVKLGGI